MPIYACELPPEQLTNSPFKKVVFWGIEDMLGRSVETLLNTRHCWNVIRITEEHDTAGLIAEIQKIRPDVLVLYQSDCSNSSPLPLQLLQTQHGMKIIIVNLENNLVEVFNKQQVLLREVADLLSIVDGCPRVPCPIEREK